MQEGLKSVKLYLVGHPIPIINAPIVRHFQGRGWDVILDTYSQSVRPWTDRILVGPTNKFLHATRIWRHPSSFKETTWSIHGYCTRSVVEGVLEHRPDVVLHISGRRLWAKELQKISRDFPMVLWMIEDLEYLKGILETAGQYRKIFVYATDWQLALKAHHIESEVLLHTYDETVFKPDPPPPPPVEHDWCFVGRHTRWREACLEKVLEVSPRGLILGSGWMKRLPSGHRLRGIWKKGTAYGTELNRLYQQCNIIIDVSQVHQRPGSGMTLRLMEALASGRKVFADEHTDHSHLKNTAGRLFSFRDLGEVPAAFQRALQAPHPNGPADFLPCSSLENLERGILEVLKDARVRA